MRVFSLFSGIGGFELGLIQAGHDIQIVGYAEIDPYASAVYSHRLADWIHGINHGDVKNIDTDTIPDFDILVGGSPCQDLSIAKRSRNGLDGEKSSLFREEITDEQTTFAE